MRRRSFFQSLLGWGAVASIPAQPPAAPPRGVAPVTVYCPNCGSTVRAPDCYDAGGDWVPLRDRMAEVAITCRNTDCQTDFRARFWVEV